MHYEGRLEAVDVEAITASYRSHARTDHLLFIARASNESSVRAEALRNALEELKQAGNLSTFQTLASQGATSASDEEWVAAATDRAANRQAKLEADLAESKVGMVKESVRMAHKDIGDFFYSLGDLQSAFKSYVRMRDHCSTPKQILAMCLAVIKVAFEIGNHVHVHSYIQKAEELPDMAADKVTSSKLKCAAGLSAMMNGQYKQAALKFTQVDAAMGSEYNDVIAPQDIATAGTLCALATFNRAEMREHLIDNINFREYLESVPQVREALSSFFNTRYAACLEALEALRPLLAVDPLLASRAQKLLQSIRNRALVQYIAPFVSVDLAVMAEALGTTIGALQMEIAQLIVAGEVAGRIDSDAGALYAQKIDQRSATFHQALRTGDQYLRNTKALLLRANLQKHNMIQVMPPPPRHCGSASGGGGTSLSKLRFIG